MPLSVDTFENKTYGTKHVSAGNGTSSSFTFTIHRFMLAKTKLKLTTIQYSFNR